MSKDTERNEKQRKQLRFNLKVDCACDNGENNGDQNIYASMARVSGNDECPSGNVGDSSQLTNYILDSGAAYHMTPDILDFIPGSLEDTDKHIEVADGYHVAEKQKGKVQIKVFSVNGDTFIATFRNVLLAPDLCK